MKHRLAGLAIAASLIAAAPVTVAPAQGPADVVAAKSCSSGYTHAVMPDGAHKCLRAGQFCSHRSGWQARYHHYGYHCKRNGHLRRR